jgi:hypothetical protein
LRIAGVAGVIGVVMLIALAIRASEPHMDQVSRGCTYYCSFPVVFRAVNIHIGP